MVDFTSSTNNPHLPKPLLILLSRLTLLPQRLAFALYSGQVDKKDFPDKLIMSMTVMQCLPAIHSLKVFSKYDEVLFTNFKNFPVKCDYLYRNVCLFLIIPSRCKNRRSFFTPSSRYLYKADMFEDKFKA